MQLSIKYWLPTIYLHAIVQITSDGSRFRLSDTASAVVAAATAVIIMDESD